MFGRAFVTHTFLYTIKFRCQLIKKRFEICMGKTVIILSGLDQLTLATHLPGWPCAFYERGTLVVKKLTNTYCNMHLHHNRGPVHDVIPCARILDSQWAGHTPLVPKSVSRVKRGFDPLCFFATSLNRTSLKPYSPLIFLIARISMPGASMGPGIAK